MSSRSVRRRRRRGRRRRRAPPASRPRTRRVRPARRANSAPMVAIATTTRHAWRRTCPAGRRCGRRSQRRQDAPTSAIGPSWAAAGEGREQRDVLARVVPAGWSGSTPWSAVRTSRSRAGSSRSSQPPTAASIAGERAGEAARVLAVAVELVRVDEVGEHEARRRARRRARSPRQRGRVVGPGMRVRRCRRPRTRRDLADRVDRHADLRRGSDAARGGGARSRGGCGMRAKRPARR